MAKRNNRELTELQEKAKKQGLSIRGKNSNQLRSMLNREERKAKAEKVVEKEKAPKQAKASPTDKTKQKPTQPTTDKMNAPWWAWLIIAVFMGVLIGSLIHFATRPPQTVEKPVQQIAGPQGPKGDTGQQGIQGPKGDKGDTGASGVVTVIVKKVVTATPMPTDTPKPTDTRAPTSTPVPSATPTSAPTTSLAAEAPQQNAQDAHFARLEALDPVFRSQGLEAWLHAAGVTWDGVLVEARQPEEETNPVTGKISLAGIQVNGKNIRINWPNIVTTDVPGRIQERSDTVKYQPDLRNGSVLYTNVVANGPVTIWIDGQTWGQFTSRLGLVVNPTQVTQVLKPVPTGCFTIAQLNAKYGLEQNAQGAQNGLLYDGTVLAGAVLKLTTVQVTELSALGWTIQGSNSMVKSAWSPTNCRPLAMQ